MSEADWIRQAQRGEKAGFAALFGAYQVKALRTAYLITRDRHMAEDLTQEAFVRAYLAISRCDPERAAASDPERPFAPWFFRILINLCRTAVARRGRQVVTAELADEGMAEPGFAAAESRELIWRELQRLEPHYRDVLMLRYYHDFSDGAIAEALELPVGTVKSRLAKARRILEERLGPAGLNVMDVQEVPS